MGIRLKKGEAANSISFRLVCRGRGGKRENERIGQRGKGEPFRKTKI